MILKRKQPMQGKHPNPKRFTMDFAPYFNMFKSHAGNALVDQLKFMADQGFRSLEDNGMKRRSIDDQEKCWNCLIISRIIPNCSCTKFRRLTQGILTIMIRKKFYIEDL